ncbi:glycine cleavage h-protein domain-containing protein [Phthorimaea operculella]|nr:glycine cleavage h-protein domain-containing protein [Phthorimaea operculella]
MGLQRCLLAATRQYLHKPSILQSNIKQTYCELYHRYSSGPPRKYSDRHEWVIVEKGTGTVGISKYAQESLGDVVFAQLPDPGTKLIAGEECGALESVKAASEIFSPVSGKVLEKNKKVEDKPALINTSCYDDGWLFKLELTKPEEVDNLMDEEAYQLFLKTDVEKEKAD